MMRYPRRRFATSEVIMMLKTMMGSSQAWLANWGLPRSGVEPGAVLLALGTMLSEFTSRVL